MKIVDEAGDAPEYRNGTSSTTHVDESSKVDRRMVFFVIGGILLAFMIGLCILVTALMLDWQK
jgi:hypothetical protein